MRLEPFPKAQAREPLCLQRTFPRACPALAPAGPRGEGPVGSSKWQFLFRGLLWRLAQHVCVLGTFYTHLHKPLPLQCCWGQLLAAAATVSPSGLTPGLSPGSARWPPEGLKSNQSFLGPGTAVLVMGLLLGEETRKGEAGRVQLPSSRSARPSRSLLLLSSCGGAN